MRRPNAFARLRARRKLERAARPRWDDPKIEDPENADRKRRAEAELAAFDRLGERARAAIANSRFDASARPFMVRGGVPVDAGVAAQVKRGDDWHSGSFGPPAPHGI